jgi:hypothetical protein
VMLGTVTAAGVALVVFPLAAAALTRVAPVADPAPTG